MKKILTIIPARMASTRLPNKPLANILGEPMIVRVFKQAKKANLGEIIVACDSAEIAEEIKKIGGTAIMTDPNLPSGTDRIFAALQKLPNNKEFEIILNLQGDLPVIDPLVIAKCVEAAMNTDADIATVASVIKNPEEITNPNVVKIAIASFDDKKLGRALYFSRASIPHGAGEYYHHIGIYAYKRNALEKFVNLNPSDLEKRESLEQLRALENGMKIAVQIVDSHPLSVDTKEDLEKVKNFLETRN
ncbi:MAG: 3-deoxy-manno-octulosonate cytidylyltransferase [Rickettsiaceae bacterium]|jgi:3-deoxy-manno-octulosonate cytidylyltransferase (CMP-KDO synthetase)|nr:3-deoxy-manno-octulosonate cytidylyltransferase [Rickettsiaceae bacterium]